MSSPPLFIAALPSGQHVRKSPPHRFVRWTYDLE
jgi:hypothetical protein